jgi:hypothetical protein
MRISRLFSGAVALSLLTPFGALADAITFGAALTATAEPTSIVVSPSDANGSGLAAITVNGTTMTFSILVKGIGTPILAHIHKAAERVSGGVVFDFHAPVFTNGFATGTVTPAPAQSDIDDLLAHPDQYYVNVHTSASPSGALRGQLGPSTQQTATFVTSLSGAGEAPGAGDPAGGGVALVTIKGITVDYTLIVQGIPTPSASHIHRGFLGLAPPGPVVVPFPNPFVNGVSSGTTTITPALAAEILSNPSGFYVNAHTPANPQGAVRGVLNAALPTTVYIPTVVKLAGLNGTSFVSDLRIVNPTGIAADVHVDFFAAAGSATGPVNTTPAHVPVSANNQAVINDVLKTTFGLDTGFGSLKVTSNVPVVVTSRVLNDLRSTNAGTNGLGVPAAATTETPTNGTLPLLSNASASDIADGKGFRTNIGYFNPTANTVTAKFTAKKNDGTIIGSTVTVPVPGFARVQQAAFGLISTVSESDRTQEDFFVTYSADGPLFVYSALVDNKTGDGIYATGANPR